MEKSTKNTLIAVGAVSVISIAGYLVIRLLRNPTNNINQTTEDFTNSKAQAARFYDLFGVYRFNGFSVATPVILTSTIKKIALLTLNIDDWAVIQQTFTSLCGGNYTVLEAAKTALSYADFQGFTTCIQKALTQKRIICSSSCITFQNGANRFGGVAGEQFSTNDFIGRCQKTDDYYYYYVSEKDGNTYCAPKGKCKLI